MPEAIYAKAKSRLPSTKPVLRLWQDAVRIEALSIMPDGTGRTKLRAAAEAMFEAAITDKNTAAMALIGDRLDGKVAVAPDENGQVSLSFVVRLPDTLNASEWQSMVSGQHPAEHLKPAVTIDAAPIQEPITDTWEQHLGEPLAGHNGQLAVVPENTEIGGIGSVSAQSVPDPVRYHSTAPPLAPIAAPDPLVLGAGHTIAGTESA